MSEPKLISPMLDNFDIGGSISAHSGVQCYPAMRRDSDNRYIVKTISIPASQTQLDALLLTGAYPDEASALSYFQELADSTVAEVEILQRLAQLEGFLPFESHQVAAMDDRVGFTVYLLSEYRRTLKKHFTRQPMTHLDAVNLGLDLCAALAVCRRLGYLYVDLKPSNIYVVGEKEFRIGDLGFIPLDSLKFASLPDKYRSEYTAPEIADAFAALNSTIDVYALGLILYQAYNGGELPFTSDTAPAEKFSAPLYADYEMAEIILKACAPDPAERWQDPIELGQALVSYMQRNGANDTPIIPPSIPIVADAMPAEPAQEPSLVTEEEETVIAEAEEIETVEDSITEDAAPADTGEPAPVENEPADAEESENVLYSEDDEGNISFLMDLIGDETYPENNLAGIEYGEVSDEVSEILSQADELAAHPVPEPAVAPDPIDVPVPEPITPEEPEAQEAQDEAAPTEAESAAEEPEAEVPVEEAAASVPEDAPEAAEDTDAAEEPADTDEAESDEDAPVKKKSHWLRTTLIILILAIIAAAGYLFYRYYYLLPINSIRVDGNESSMVVHVDSNIDEALLSVVCSDSHGNQLSAPVVDGTATFANLAPDTAYNVKVLVDGFHRLTGDVSGSYSTPPQTKIVQFSAVTGPEDGSVILGFTVEGPDSGQWSVVYSAEGEEETSVELLSHMVTLNGLTVGKEYTFKLVPNSDMYVTGTDQITFTASQLVYAQDLMILSCVDNQLTASWAAPEDVEVSNWTVRCYNSTSEYNQTFITSETSITFEDVDCADSYTVEVTAAGMSVSQRAYVAENAITVSNFQADTSSATNLRLSWDSSLNIPEGGWILLYSVDGSETQHTLITTQNSAEITPVVPNATYSFTLQDINGADVLSAPLSCQTADTVDFSGYGTTTESMTFELCRTPAVSNWDADDLNDSDYTDTFAVGESISVLAKLLHRYGVSDDNITTMFVIRDESGKVVNYSSVTQAWSSMWYRYYCELDIPEVPEEAGQYTLSIYFNGQFVTEEAFTIA